MDEPTPLPPPDHGPAGDRAGAGVDDRVDQDLDDGVDQDLDDGVDAQAVLGEVFLAADRLARRATDPDGTRRLVQAHATVATMARPFGFDEPVWTDLVAHVEALHAAVLADPGTGAALGQDRIEELAEDLRARLRPLV
jgi:hypothetical protein